MSERPHYQLIKLLQRCCCCTVSHRMERLRLANSSLSRMFDDTANFALICNQLTNGILESTIPLNDKYNWREIHILIAPRYPSAPGRCDERTNSSNVFIHSILCSAGAAGSTISRNINSQCTLSTLQNSFRFIINLIKSFRFANWILSAASQLFLFRCADDKTCTFEFALNQTI